MWLKIFNQSEKSVQSYYDFIKNVGRIENLTRDCISSSLLTEPGYAESHNEILKIFNKCTLKKQRLKITQLEKVCFIKVNELKLTQVELF